MDTSKMHKTSFPLRLWNILASPHQEWEKIKKENHSGNFLFWNWAFPLILTMALAGVAGELVVNKEGGINISRLLLSTTSTILFSVISLFLSALIVKFLACHAVEGNRFSTAFRLISYSYTAGFAANILAFLIPSLSFLSILGLYSFYLLWIGIAPILNIPKDKTSGYFTFILIALIAIYVILGLCLTSIMSLYSLSKGF